MKIVIRFTAKQEALAYPILFRHKPGMILPDRTYILSVETVQLLRKEGIQFKEISRDSELTRQEGASVGERI